MSDPETNTNIVPLTVEADPQLMRERDRADKAEASLIQAEATIAGQAALIAAADAKAQDALKRADALERAESQLGNIFRSATLIHAGFA